MTDKLTVFEKDGTLWTDSRDVAAMVDKRHDHLVRDIRGYIEILLAAPKIGDSDTEPNFGPSDFFVESTYTDSTGRTLPCFLLSKKGCEFVANKLTGQKGVIFTAAYVTGFNDMEEHIKTGKVLPPKENPFAVLDAEARRMRAAAMALNAKNRAAKMMLDTYSEAGIAPQYKVLALKEVYADTGISVPTEGLQIGQKTYDATAIAQRLGIMSLAGNPHAHAVSAIIEHIHPAKEECVRVPCVNPVNGHADSTMQYADSVIEKVRDWLKDRDNPTRITKADGSKTYTVRYEKEI
ncbi:Rha family transcriptional regulator [Anaerotruncus rubiinfantis]|uniref:Rha family transcriptional regulator n=1 Tax=Anaerotruncus rubiinfantis TaxID=1720200 RepID=UPI0034A19D6C